MTNPELTPAGRFGPSPPLCRFGFMVGAVILALAPSGCGASSRPTAAEDAQPKPVPVTVTAVKADTIRRTIPVVGTLNAYADVMLAPKVDGRVARVYKNEGETVYPGEILLELDPTDYQLAVEQARASLQAELRKLKLDRLPTDEEFRQHIPSIDTVAQARANLELAEKEAARAELEASRGVGSPQGLDAARTRVKVARTALDLAETEARVSLAVARRFKVLLDDAEERLRETRLTAPTPDEWAVWSALVGPAANPVRYSVAARMVTTGTMISPTRVSTAYRLILDHILKLRVPVPEKHRPEVAVGQTVEIRVDAYPDTVFRGSVARVFPTIDPSTRTFVTEIEVPNINRRLTAGGFARAEILTRASETVLFVPPEAVVSFAGTYKVFLVEEGIAKAVEVQVGLWDKERVEVRGRLQAGDQVVTSGQKQLVDGSPIRLR